jgi:radical SAM superfamily enzyme YgiQ (UPF0313 family)
LRRQALRDGLLQDTEESIEELIRFACELDTTYANFKILTPYPGTPQFKQIKPLILKRIGKSLMATR